MTEQVDWTAFGRLLRDLRRRRGLTQLQLADRLGYHHTQISRLESGRRQPGEDFTERADRLLRAEGALTSLRHATRRRRPASRSTSPIPAVPLPAGVLPATVLRPDNRWPSHLPAAGVFCPLHPADACALPEPAALTAYFAVPGRLTRQPQWRDPFAVHAFAALAAVYALAGDRQHTARGLPLVEALGHALRRWALTSADPADRRIPLWLAATYARLAGRLHFVGGRNGPAMTWLGIGADWAELAGAADTRATLLAHMCMVACADRDAVALLELARRLATTRPERAWTRAAANLHAARGHALAGRPYAHLHHLRLAHDWRRRADGWDRLSAPWLPGQRGDVVLASHHGAALRDLAALSGDRRQARSAVREIARVWDPAAPAPESLIFTARLADAHACAGDLDAALATLDVLPPPTAEPHGLLAHELTGLRRRLTSLGAPRSRADIWLNPPAQRAG
ncbi:helix-turn-helix domain-containing protein [Pilimelia anulata]|uniref:helix-turn-helix domain-containing protein n=1 Tax=Pilimelia anulata TaxID=53371 RepID=UPI0016649362|nr:helix-turn-helix transcriptional regulator [Pilimelia anulata]